MTRRAALLVLAAALAASAGPAAAQAPDPPRGRAFIFLIDRVSFEELLAVPEFLALARAGGAAMLGQRLHPDDEGLGPYLTIGSGAKAAVPSSRIAPLPAHAGLPPVTLAAIDRVNDGAVPGLLGQLIAGAGYGVEVYGNADDRFGPNTPGLLVAMDLEGSANGQVHGLTLPRPGRLGGRRTDPARLLTLLSRDDAPAGLVVVDLGDTHRIDQEAPYADAEAAATQRQRSLARDGAIVRAIVEGAGGPVQVIVVAPSASRDMRERGDVVTPIVLAEGPAEDLFPSAGEPHGLTSDSTRYDGLVLAEDVAPTVLRYFGVPAPDEVTGAPIRTSGAAPFADHLRHLEHRRIRLPIQIGFGLGGLLLGAGGAWFAFSRRRFSARALAVAGATATCATAVPLALLAAGVLPHLVYAQVVPTAVAVAAGAGLLAWSRRDRDPTLPVVLVAAATGAAVLLDGLAGWSVSDAALAGGTVWEGRAFGIRNIWLGPVMGGSILVASRLPARWGLGLMLGVATLVGLPGFGADIGGFVTLSLAGWLLYSLLSRGRLGWREAVIGLAVTAAGVAAILFIDGVLNPTPTHLGRFAERVASGGAGTFFQVVFERLRLSLQTIRQVPAAWILLALFVYLAWLAPRIRGDAGAAFDRAPGYREAMWTLAIATIVTAVVNDSGISTAQMTAAYSIGGFAVPALVLRLRRARAPEAAPRERVRVPVPG